MYLLSQNNKISLVLALNMFNVSEQNIVTVVYMVDNSFTTGSGWVSLFIVIAGLRLRALCSNFIRQIVWP